jgi:hypothetical protein
MHTYEQKTGRWFRNGLFIWTAFSGHEEGLNNPLLQQIHAVGPIPQGCYTIGAPINHPKLGPFAMPLTPKPGTNTFGRSGFYLHGDSSADYDETASLGCIVKSPQSARVLIWLCDDHDLEVVSGEVPLNVT